MADLGDDVGYLPEYLQRLTGLEDDGLPGYENRFFELLQRQARNNISQLAQVIKGARREVRMRVDEVNKSLLMTEFARGSYLQIEVRDRALPAVEEFLATLGEITSGSFDDAFAGTDDRAAAERRFEAMRRLLEKLSSEDPADKKWRQLCLDTRQHVQFQARVQDADGVALDHYTGSGGRSGGERQRLVTSAWPRRCGSSWRRPGSWYQAMLSWSSMRPLTRPITSSPEPGWRSSGSSGSNCCWPPR